MSFILYNNKIKLNFSTGEWILVVRIYVVLDRCLPFLYGVNSLQARTGQISQIITGKCWGTISYSDVSLQNRKSFTLWSFCREK